QLLELVELGLGRVVVGRGRRRALLEGEVLVQVAGDEEGHARQLVGSEPGFELAGVGSVAGTHRRTSGYAVRTYQSRPRRRRMTRAASAGSELAAPRSRTRPSGAPSPGQRTTRLPAARRPLQVSIRVRSRVSASATARSAVARSVKVEAAARCGSRSRRRA